MLPNMMAANMMGLGAMNMNAFQQQQQFQVCVSFDGASSASTMFLP
jgi:S-formylglutathione hydrolase FrmB